MPTINQLNFYLKFGAKYLAAVAITFAVKTFFNDIEFVGTPVAIEFIER